jgi:hypothetical protein
MVVLSGEPLLSNGMIAAQDRIAPLGRRFGRGAAYTEGAVDAITAPVAEPITS